MKVLIFDICFSVVGHRIPYTGLVAEAFADCEVTVAFPQQLEGEPVLENYFSDRVSFQFFESEPKALSVRESWRCLVQQIEQCRPDMVAVPTGDGMAIWGGVKNLVGLAGTGGVPIDVSLMRGHYRSPSDSWLKKTISNFKWWLVTKGPWRKILLLDPRSFENLKNPASQNIVLCPDPAPPQKFTDRQQARVALGLPEKGRMIVSVGNQEVRKGSDLLLQAFDQADLAPDDFLVLIGKFDSKTKQLAENMLGTGIKKNRLIVRDTFVSDDELQQAVVASNLVAVPYRDVERPSGIISRSVAWSRPLIGTDRGWIKWFIERYQAGYLTPSENILQFAKDLKYALIDCEGFVTSESAEEFRRFNTESCYLRAWKQQTNLKSHQR